MKSKQSKGVAIIGLSGRFPGGANPDRLWETLTAGVDAVTEARGDRWDLGWHNPDTHRAGRVYTKAGGFLDRIDGFDAEFFGLSPREVRQVDPQQRLLLELAWEAMEDAGIAPATMVGANTGVFVGISSNDYGSLVGQEWPDAYSNTGSSFSIAANRISYIFDLHGPSVAVDTACSSSIVCLHQACVSILAGECETALAGGVSLLTHIRPWLGFARASMLSPTGRCKSFDASGDGYVRSEGGGLVLLKELSAAERDGDRILGVILASGVNSDGRTMGLSMPNGEAQEQLLRTVYAQCGVKPEDVFYVEAHGTGTAVGDPIECGALGRVLGAPRADGSKCLIGSVKSNIGHLEAASGIAGLTKLLLSLKNRKVPGNLHFHTPNPKIEFENWKLQVVTEATPFPEQEKPLVFGINSFGFGGTNAHAVIQEYKAPAAKPLPQAPQILVLSGHTEAALKAVAASYVELLHQPEAADWPVICAGAATCRDQHRFRLVLSAQSSAEAAEKLESYLSGEGVARLATGTAATNNAPIAFVYSGNGPQWWGMGRELLAENAIFRAEIEAVDAIFAPLAGWSLLDEMQRPEGENRIGLTEVAQPLLFALQLGLTQVLRAAGISPSAVLGHSVGEAAAAWASGALTREQATEVIYYRSREQAKTAGQGRMAALGVSAAEARKAMAEVPGWLEVAAVNAPDAVTVAGDPTALQALVERMTAAGKFARMLNLDYPFHTKAMDPIRQDLVEALAALCPSATQIPFVSTVDGKELAGQSLDADYWFRNVRETVLFHDAVQQLLQERGIAVFLEVGPHPVLKDYVQQSARAAGVSITALQSLRRPSAKGPEPESDNLWTAICAAHAAGASHLQQLFQRPSPPPALPLYPWQHTRHWRGEVYLPDIYVPTRRDHPLLGHRASVAAGLWENVLDLHQLPYLRDHVVQKSVLFPAAGYIDMSLEAGRLNFGPGPIDLENIEVLRPLTIADHSDPLVQTAVDDKDGTLEIHSKPDKDAADWTLHFRGRLSKGSQVRPAAVSPAEIAARLPVQVPVASHYADASNRGLDYGPEFQGVANIRLSESTANRREALAEICIPGATGQAYAGYVAHPALLDSCVQVLIALVAQTEKRNCCTIPVQMGRVRSFAPLTNAMFCHVTVLSESDRSVTADFRVLDAEGNLLLAIDEGRCSKVDFQKATPTPLISEWWRPDLQTPAMAAPAPLPLPAETMAAVPVAELVEVNERVAFYNELQPAMERLAGAYAAKAIAALEPGEGSFNLSRLARKGGVRREQQGLLAKLVQMAEEDGQLLPSNSGWKWNASQPLLDPEAMWRSLFAAHPRYHAELLLLAEAGENLVATLRGEGGEASASWLDQLQENAPFQLIYNQMAQRVVARLMTTWPADRPIRILELGGAGGGLAAWLLPCLPASRADYCFTDGSEASVARAAHRFAGFRFARFERLDLDQDFLSQSMPNGYFDLVVGANFAKAGVPLAELLARLGNVMTEDGQLMVVEAEANRFAQLVLGKASTQWGEELIAAGFEAPVFLTDTEMGQQRLLLARRSPMSGLHGKNESSSAVPANTSSQRWMLVVEAADRDNGFATLVAQTLTAHGQMVQMHCFENAEAVRSVMEAELPDEVVLLSSLGSTNLLETQLLRTMVAVEVVKSIEELRQERSCLLTVVTRGAFPTANGTPAVDPGQAPLWGLARVIGNEHTSVSPRMIDLHAETAGSPEADWLTTELLRRGAETEVQISQGHRYVNRQRINAVEELAFQEASLPEAYELAFHPQAGLDSLHLRETQRQAPESDQVEIAVMAAGLNFRDVLWSMGMLPEEAVEHGFSGPTIGMECAGQVVRVGANVTNLKPGDRVVAFASSCFGSHVTTSAGSVVKMPEDLDYAAAATIPTAFLTAYYAFDHLARLEAGETVLIHGAAGGVGMAAIQIAKLKGAKVIGTAGSARKRRMLQMLGVDHVLNSRSLDFATEVMQITGGVGVDVVLNSLAGEAITKSLQCLRPFGRFLEIGKRDLYANSRIGLRPFRINLSYFGIDADTLLVERPELARRMFRAVMDHFAAGELRPVPFQEVPISRAAEAFRAMQQSRHIGKLVVSMGLDQPGHLRVARQRKPVKPEGTYLVTGGLGGFGLTTARWLVAEGATSLALVSRRGANSEEATAALAEFEKQGIAVRAFAADIADLTSVESVLQIIRQEMAPLIGVVHSAAVIEDAPITRMDAKQIARVYLPKLIGAWNLHQATLDDRLEMFVMYSSSSAVVGNPGQGAYVAANLYLDALALHRRSQGLPALAVGWGAIKDAGFLTRHQAVAGMLKSRTGMDATPAHEALADLGRLCAVGAARVCVARFDLLRLDQMVAGARVPRFRPIIPKNAVDSLQSEETLAEVLARTPEANRRDLVLARVREQAARVLGTAAEQVNVELPLSSLGLDSLMAVELAGGLERDLGKPVSVMQLLSAGSLTAISELLLKMLPSSGEAVDIASAAEIAKQKGTSPTSGAAVAMELQEVRP